MRIFSSVRNILPGWRWRKAAMPPNASENEAQEANDRHLAQAAHSLRRLLEDPSIPPSLRVSLAEDYQQIETMCHKLEYGHIHLAVFGKVGVGKSALLNALLGRAHFSMGPLHGVTRHPESIQWGTDEAEGVYLFDTPGINEIAGEEQERLAHEVASRSDLVIFVAEGDLTRSEVAGLRTIAAEQRPVLLALNKADRYTQEERQLLLAQLAERTQGIIRPMDIIPVSSAPAERIVLQVDAAGEEHEVRRQPPPELEALRDRIWTVLESEGKTLAALNASLFAARLSDQIASRITEIHRDLAERVVRTYSLTKGLAVAVNPVPVADLLAAASWDVAMVLRLSKVYGLPVTRAEAGRLVTTIVGQLGVLMGTVWGINLASASLKGFSAGLSVVLTAGSQGALAYYATYLVGRAAEHYFARGRSWGEGGPKQIVQEILETVDRDSILAEARQEIRNRLSAAKMQRSSRSSG